MVTLLVIDNTTSEIAMTAHAQAAQFLNPRLIYLLDAGASLVMGLAVAAWAGPLTELAGWPLPAAFLQVIGVLLLPWAAFNLWIARRDPSVPHAVRGNILGDIVWVAGTILLLALYASPLTGLGMLLLAGQGLAVGMVLVVKLMGARQLMG